MTHNKTGRVVTNTTLQGIFLGLTLMTQAGCGADSPTEVEETVVTGEEELSSASGAMIVDWNEHTVATLTQHDGYAEPYPASRVFAMVHVAMHDAVSATAHRRYHGYAYRDRDTWADPRAAAASAAYHVLVQQFPAQEASLQQRFDSSLAAIPDGARETRGVALGQRVAQVIVDLRADDGSDEEFPYMPATAPGRYQYTMDGFIYRSGWQHTDLWALESADQFRPGAPPPLSSKAYARAYREVKSKGALESVSRTHDETNYAKFWYELSESGWNRITRILATQERLDLAKTARLFALANMALADSYVAGWDAKFHYDTWRPITAIRVGDSDGNPATGADAKWEPLMTTPPVQDYPSTHSVLGDAAAEVIARVLHRDDIRFESPSTSFEGTRRWSSLSEAANENADSRVMAGIHFRFSTRTGQRMGRQIGRYVAETHLQPLP